jgi:hypothetical protein
MEHFKSALPSIATDAGTPPIGSSVPKGDLPRPCRGILRGDADWVLSESEINCCGTTIFADSQPRCIQFGERSALEAKEKPTSRIDSLNVKSELDANTRVSIPFVDIKQYLERAGS